jgi:hypothetical protein
MAATGVCPFKTCSKYRRKEVQLGSTLKVVSWEFIRSKSDWFPASYFLLYQFE